MPIYRHPITSCEQKSARRLKNIPLDKELIERLKTTYRSARGENDLSLARVFYHKLFSAHPMLREMFPEDLEQQAAKLISMFDQVVNNLEHPEENSKRLADLGRRHRGYGVQPEHYPIVVKLLTESMQELIGLTENAKAKQDSIEEWRLMLTLISQQMTRQSGSDSVEKMFP
jgi:hemoglobin-like flavoprotein